MRSPTVPVGQKFRHSLTGLSTSGSHQVVIHMSARGDVSSGADLGIDLFLSSQVVGMHLLAGLRPHLAGCWLGVVHNSKRKLTVPCHVALSRGPLIIAYFSKPTTQQNFLFSFQFY